MNLKALYAEFLKNPRITTDTRKDLEGSIFFCLKGPNFNANLFVKEAKEKGAALIVTDDVSYQGESGIAVVQDALGSLQELARYHRQQFAFPLIGLTGSNGKTTNKELIAAVLSTRFHTAATRGNLNNHIGVPLTLLEIPQSAEMAVIEMGANHQGEIRDLSNICLPEFGMITNIGLAHLEGFGGPEGVKKGKKELFDHIKSHGGKLFVNANDAVLMEISEGIDRVLFGSHAGTLVDGAIVQNHPFVSFQYRQLNYQSETIKTQLVGDYNLPNLLAAVCIGLYFGIDHLQIKSALEGYAPSNQRSQLIKTKSNTIIMDAYNANPSSMEVAIRNFSEMEGSKIAMIGHMLELGEATITEHQKVIDLLCTLNIEAYLVGSNFQTCDMHGYKHFNSSDGLYTSLQEKPLTDRIILLKGSRMAAMEKLEKVL